jgi:protein-disulfide isomerase
MKAQVEAVLSVLLMVAGGAVAVSVVHREFFQAPPPLLSFGPAAPPAYVNDWQKLLPTGVLIGDSAARIKIVEFGDFECPFCKKFHAAYSGLQKEYGNDVALVFVHYPLSIHRFARPAARAAECAGAQGSFTRFYDALFDKQDSLGLKPWTSYAIEAGVRDTLAFVRCASDTITVARVEAGRALGEKIGVQATPTVIVNGWRLGWVPYDTLGKLVASLVTKKPR